MYNIINVFEIVILVLLKKIIVFVNMMIFPLSIKHINHITSDRYMYIKILGFFNNGMDKTPYYINQNNVKHIKKIFICNYFKKS